MTRWKLRIWFRDQPTISNTEIFRSDCEKCVVKRMITRQNTMATNLRVSYRRIAWTAMMPTGHLDDYQIVYTDQNYPAGWVRCHVH